MQRPLLADRSRKLEGVDEDKEDNNGDHKVKSTGGVGDHVMVEVMTECATFKLIRNGDDVTWFPRGAMMTTSDRSRSHSLMLRDAHKVMIAVKFILDVRRTG